MHNITRALTFSVLLAVAGCSTAQGAHRESHPVNPVRAAAQADVSPGVSGQTDESLVAAVRSMSPGTADLTGQEIVALAKGTCTRLDDGAQYVDLVRELERPEIDEEERAASVDVMVAGMAYLCRHHFAVAIE